MSLYLYCSGPDRTPSPPNFTSVIQTSNSCYPYNVPGSVSLVPARGITYQPHFSSANRVFPTTGMEHAQSTFYNQSNAEFSNDVVTQRAKDTKSMAQYYSQTFNERVTDCETDIKESKHSPFANQNRLNNYTGHVDSLVKYERQNSPECAFLNSPVKYGSQNGDCQMSNGKGGSDNFCKRTGNFSSEFDPLLKRTKYTENGFVTNGKEGDPRDLMKTTETTGNSSSSQFGTKEGDIEKNREAANSSDICFNSSWQS